MSNNSDTDLPIKKDTFVTGVDVPQRQKPNQKHNYLPPLKRPGTSKPDYNFNRKPLYQNKYKGPIKSKKHENYYEKIFFPPPNEDYYRIVNEIYKITPGWQFFKRLFTHDNAEKAIPGLKLNVPETYWNDNEMMYVYNDMSNYGALTIIRNKKDFGLFESFLKVETEQYRRTFKDYEPFLIYRSVENDYENTVKVERYGKAEDNLSKDSGDGLIQRYIRCRGKNRELDRYYKDKGGWYGDKEKTNLENWNKVERVQKKTVNENHPDINTGDNDEKNQNAKKNGKDNDNNPDKKDKEKRQSCTKPTVVRWEYKTRYNKQKGGNIAYCLINKNFVEPSIEAGTKAIFEKYTSYTTLNSKNPKSFYIYIMTGESIAPYEFYAYNWVQYLQKWFKLLLQTIVCDFMKDERGIIYFIGCRSFTLVTEPTEQDELHPEMLLHRINEEDNEIRKWYRTHTCSLCILPYPKNKITKVVTFKLLYKLKDNLKKRGFNHFEHIINNIYNESESCRVCDWCYTLLVTEQELMEIQKTIALCTNIEVPNDDWLNNESKVPEGLVRAPQKYKQWVQWRIMFYFLKFYFFDYSAFPFEDGSQVPPNATPAEKKKGKTNYKLVITLFNQKIEIPIFTEMKEFVAKDEVVLNTAKMFYFFSTENSNVKQILKNEPVDFRIVINDKYNDPWASCKTTCFSCYDEGVREKPMTTKTILNFFSEYINHFKCQAFIGLKHDGLVQTDNLQMYCYKLPNPIYITDWDYYSYNTLPNDWYELFIPPETKIEDENFYEIDKVIDKIIKDLDIKSFKRKAEDYDEDEVYDPYDIWVQVKNKNDIINKISSIPIVLDKSFVEMKQEEKKERPVTSKLKLKYFFNNEKKQVQKRSSSTSQINESNSFKSRINSKRDSKLIEDEMQRQREEEKFIKEANVDDIDKLLAQQDSHWNAWIDETRK